MAIIDSTMEFVPTHPPSSIAGGVGTTLVGATIDSWQTGQDLELWLSVTTSDAIVGAAGSTIRFQLASSPLSTIPTTGSTLVQSADFAVGVAGIPAGTRLFTCAVPRSLTTVNPAGRFLGLLVTIAGAAITAGSITARLVEPDSVESWIATPQAAN